MVAVSCLCWLSMRPRALAPFPVSAPDCLQSVLIVLSNLYAFSASCLLAGDTLLFTFLSLFLISLPPSLPRSPRRKIKPADSRVWAAGWRRGTLSQEHRQKPHTKPSHQKNAVCPAIVLRRVFRYERRNSNLRPCSGRRAAQQLISYTLACLRRALT